jgi:hypothetical protein
MNKTWGRLYAGTRHHRKIRLLRERHPQSWWIWYTLLEMAFECDDYGDNGGLVHVSPGVPFSEEELAKELCLPSKRLLNPTLTTLINLGMIEFDAGCIRLLSYNDRQYKSDSSTERVRKHRKIQKVGKVEEAEAERFGNVSETDRTEQTTSGQNINTPPTPPEGENSGKGGGRRRKKFERAEFSPEFNQFSSAYPNAKGGLDRAWKIWQARKRAGNLPEFGELMADLEILKKSPEWNQDSGKYVPMITNFLEHGRWTDAEPEKRKRARSSPAPRSAALARRGNPDCPVCKGGGEKKIMERGVPYMVPCDCRIRRPGGPGESPPSAEA